MALSRLIARPMLASMFLVGGFSAVRNPDKIAPRAQSVTDRLVPLDVFDRPRPWIPTSPSVLRILLDHGVLP